MVREFVAQAAETEAWKKDLLVPSWLLLLGFIFVPCRDRKYDKILSEITFERRKLLGTEKNYKKAETYIFQEWS